MRVRVLVKDLSRADKYTSLWQRYFHCGSIIIFVVVLSLLQDHYLCGSIIIFVVVLSLLQDYYLCGSIIIIMAVLLSWW